MKHNVISAPYGCAGEGRTVPVFSAWAQNEPSISVNCDNVCAGEALYYGQPTQNVPAGGRLMLTAYSPAGNGNAVDSIRLGEGRWVITYAVNASALESACPVNDPACTVTLGVSPWINGTNFPRGSSFATLRAEGSTALGSSFVVDLTGAENTLGFYNPGQLPTNYQLLNITATRV